MLVQGELGRNNAGRRAARASSSSSGSSRARSRTSSSTGQVKTRVAACMQAGEPAIVPDSAGGLRWRLVKIHWRSEAQSEYKQILFAFRTGQVLNTDLEVGAAGNPRCMTSAAFSNLDSK